MEWARAIKIESWHGGLNSQHFFGMNYWKGGEYGFNTNKVIGDVQGGGRHVEIKFGDGNGEERKR